MDLTFMTLILQFMKGNSEKKIFLPFLKANSKNTTFTITSCNSCKLHTGQTDSSMEAKVNFEIRIAIKDAIRSLFDPSSLGFSTLLISISGKHSSEQGLEVRPYEGMGDLGVPCAQVFGVGDEHED